jgi:protein-S-isoprenylcysteine O-methyltransferase Ste14
MRWLVLIFLLLGALFASTFFFPAPAGEAELFRPFTTDSQPLVGFAGGQPGASDIGLTSLLAAVAVCGFFAAVIGLFWKAIPAAWWPSMVMVAIVASLLLYLCYFSVWMIAPILVNGVLLWGVLTKYWSADILPARSQPADAPPIHPLMNIPVPWVFLLTYLVGLTLHFFIPIPLPVGSLLLALRIAGIILVVGGVLIAFSSLGIFRTAHTTTVPFETPSALITSGPYRYSRNPMYGGLTLIYVGEAITQLQIWPLLVLPFLLFYIDRVVIPVEEGRLREAFGESYELYCAGVRRWL